MLATTISSRRTRTFTAVSPYIDKKLLGKYDNSDLWYASNPTPQDSIEAYKAFASGPVAYVRTQLALLYVHIPFRDAIRHARNNNKLTAQIASDRRDTWVN